MAKDWERDNNEAVSLDSINKRIKKLEQDKRDLSSFAVGADKVFDSSKATRLSNINNELKDLYAQRNKLAGPSAGYSTQKPLAADVATQNQIQYDNQDPQNKPESTQANEAKYKDAYNRIKAGKASNEDLLLFKDFTTEKLKETGFGPRSIDAIQRAAKGDFSNKPVTTQEPLPQNKPEGNSSTTTATQKHEPGIADQINAEKGIDSVSGGKDLNGDGHYDLQDAKIAMEKAKVAYDEATREYNRLKGMQPKAKIKAIPGSGMSGQLGQKQGR